MSISALAGKPAPKEMLIDPARLEREYFESLPDLGVTARFAQNSTLSRPLIGTDAEPPAFQPLIAFRCDFGTGF
jgi:phosphoglucomutase